MFILFPAFKKVVGGAFGYRASVCLFDTGSLAHLCQDFVKVKVASVNRASV